MPLPVHEIFIDKLTDEFKKELRAFNDSRDPVISLAAQSTEDRRHTNIELDTNTIRSPDAAFGTRSANFPGVVCEVLYAQNPKELKYIAQDYISGSNADIGVVVGVNISYPDTKEGTLFVWRPAFTADETGHEIAECRQIISETFRHADGTVVDDGKGLILSLEDFISGATFDSNSPLTTTADIQWPSITISSSRLAQLLAEAEKRHELVRSQTGVSSLRRRRLGTGPGERSWKRSKRTPIPPLSETDV